MPWHKIVALLMHEFEITEFEITSGTLNGFKQEFEGEIPSVTFEDSGSVITIRLMTKSEASRRVQ